MIIVVSITPTLAAKAATNTIPIVFSVGGDPVQFSIVTSLNRPVGNITGVYNLNTAVMGKRLELLREMVPAAGVIALLVNPNSAAREAETKEVNEAARALGLEIRILNATSESEIDAAFATLAKERSVPLVVSSDNLFTDRPVRLVVLAARHAIPAIYPYRWFAAAGGLMSYGPDLAEAYRLVGTYAGRILKGAKPADLPIQQVVKVELVINLKTVKAPGITVPLPLSGRADEVIELLGSVAVTWPSRRARSKASGCGGSACSPPLQSRIKNQRPASQHELPGLSALERRKDNNAAETS